MKEGMAIPSSYFECRIPRTVDRRAWWAIVHRVAKSDMTAVTRCTHRYLLKQNNNNKTVTFPGLYKLTPCRGRKSLISLVCRLRFFYGVF